MPIYTKPVERRRFLKYVGGATATIAGYTGDSGETPQEETDTETTEGPPGETTESSEDKELNLRENTLTFASLGEEIRSIDPHKVSDDITQQVGLTLYDPLISVNEDGIPNGHLVTDWRFDNQGKTWIFDLREDVQFHSGNILTAEDVVYSANR